MLGTNVWRRVLGVDRATVIEGVEVGDAANAVVAHLRPRRASKRRCGRCGVPATGYDQGEGRRWWRVLDLGTVKCFLESDASRVARPGHGPTGAQVPWARHGAGHSRDFDDQAAWRSRTRPSRRCPSSCASPGARSDRSSPGSWPMAAPSTTPSRVSGGSASTRSAYKKGHRYLLIAVDHDTSQLRVGGRRARQEDPARLLRPPRRGTVRQDPPGRRRCGRVDRGGGPRPGEERRALHRWVPRGLLGHRRARRGPPRGVERGPPRRDDGARRGAMRGRALVS